MVELRHFLRIRTTPEKVYEALTTNTGLEGWWVRKATGEHKEKSELEFSFGNYPGMRVEIETLEEHKKVVWKGLNNPEDDEWMADTTITFDLAQEGDNTTIMRFSHSGWMEESEMLDNINYNWGRFMYSLKMYAETGKGHPVTD